MGGTYAYFALTAVNENTVVGVVGSADLDLKVEKILPTSNTGDMVPQLESALGTAISSQYNCVDDNGNVVCQVYKATLTNESTSNISLNGSVFFTGIDNLPNLTCSRSIDKFTVSEENGNGDLDYPVGLLTYSELMMAGGASSAKSSYYLYSGSNHWAGSPLWFHSFDVANVSSVGSDGFVNVNDVIGVGDVRPAISLKSGFSLTGNGDGSVTNPYIVG